MAELIDTCNAMNKMICFLMGGIMLATMFAASAVDAAELPALARKTGGAPERLLEKQQEHHKGATQKQPTPEKRLARKVGGAKTRLLWQVRHRSARV